MAEEIAFENGWISNSEGLVTLTSNRVILHTIMHHSSTSTYIPNFIEIGETLWTDGRTDGQTIETGFIRSTLPSQFLGLGQTNQGTLQPRSPYGAEGKEGVKTTVSDSVRKYSHIQLKINPSRRIERAVRSCRRLPHKNAVGKIVFVRPFKHL